MVDPFALHLEQVAAVVEVLHLRVDHRVLLADDLRGHADVDLLAGLDHRHPFGDVGSVLADLRRDRPDREHRSVGAPQVVRGVVVGVLVGDQHHAGAVHRLRLGEAARVEDDRGVTGLESHARMTELRDPHGISVWCLLLNTVQERDW